MLTPRSHPLWGIEHGCRTVVIYSPTDLSCYWNQSEHNPNNVAVINAVKVGQNVIDYATGREMPADKLTVREIRDIKVAAAEARRPADRQARSILATGTSRPRPSRTSWTHSASPRSASTSSSPRKTCFPGTPTSSTIPSSISTVRGSVSFPREDLEALRQHLEPVEGRCSPTPRAAAPRSTRPSGSSSPICCPTVVSVPIPRDDELYTTKVGFDLSDSQYTKAAGGGKDLPQLEGVKINDHWAIIYSKNDIGCALERHTGIDCKGYTYESASRSPAISSFTPRCRDGRDTLVRRCRDPPLFPGAVRRRSPARFRDRVGLGKPRLDLALDATPRTVPGRIPPKEGHDETADQMNIL